MSLSPLLTVTVGPALPTYISSQPLLTWIDVPRSQVATATNGYAKTGGVDNFPWQVFVDKGIFDYSIGQCIHYPGGPTAARGQFSALRSLWAWGGFWFRRANGEVGHCAPCGPGVWNGNDITSIAVFDENPQWTVRVPPRDVSLTWPGNNSPLFDGVTRYTWRDGSVSSHHTYYTDQFIDAHDVYLKIGTKNMWTNDMGFSKQVHRWVYGSPDWTLPRVDADLPFDGNAPDFDNFPTVTDPSTGVTYMIWNHQQLWSRNFITQPGCTLVPGFASTPHEMSNGGVTLDSIRFPQGSICFWRRSNGQFGLFGISEAIGQGQTRGTFWMFEVSNGGVWHNLTNVTGIPPTPAQPFGNPESIPVTFDPVGENFYLWDYINRAQLYKLTPDWSGGLAITPFTPANNPNTGATRPQYDCAGDPTMHIGIVGQHMFVARNCLILAHLMRDPFKIVRLQ